MAGYTPNIWIDREGTTRYYETVDEDGALIFTPDYTQVTELGTPVNADNMNHIEEGIAATSFSKYASMTTYAKDDLVTSIIDEELKVYKSLKDNNIGNALANTEYWEEVEFGGSGGLEIGDIGIAPLGIDETKGKRRYINGQLIIQEQFVQFTNKVKTAVKLYPSLACTEEEWQTIATMTVGGQVGKFVIDDEAGTIRLPRIIMPIQNLTDLNSLAEIVEAGLPNIEGRWASRGIENYSISATGAFYSGGKNGKGAAGDSSSGVTIGFDASLSNTIYGNSTTVQQEQIQYPYFIQVATGAETKDNIINEIELNNPFSLLDYKFSEYELNNISWLRSNNQFEPKAIYPAVYDLLLKIYNGTEIKAGVSVKLFGEEYTDYDFVLNTAEETFRLPVKVKLASGKAIAGNGMALGLTDGTIETGMHQVSGSNYTYLQGKGEIALNVGAGKSGGDYLAANKAIGITTDSTKSGIETSDNGLYLYFYVGETVQNANLINAGRIEEKLTLMADKTDVDGQWVAKELEFLNESTTTGDLDLSTYLPADSYNYEVLFSYLYQAGASSGVHNYIYSDIVPSQMEIAFISTSTTTTSAGIFSLPIGAERKITLEGSSKKTLKANAYRRIGLNQ